MDARQLYAAALTEPPHHMRVCRDQRAEVSLGHPDSRAILRDDRQHVGICYEALHNALLNKLERIIKMVH